MEDSEQLIASKHNKPAEASVRVYSCKEKEPVYQQRVAKEEGLEAVHVPIPSTCFCIKNRRARRFFFWGEWLFCKVCFFETIYPLLKWFKWLRKFLSRKKSRLRNSPNQKRQNEEGEKMWNQKGSFWVANDCDSETPQTKKDQKEGEKRWKN